MFSGFRSPWINPLLWNAPSPLISCIITEMNSSEKPLKCLFIGFPETYSSVKYGLLSLVML